MKIVEFNDLDHTTAYKTMETCCAAPAWIEAMVGNRPFDNLNHLLTDAANKWLAMDESDLLAAFLAHPKIGNVESLHKKFANTKAIASNEQSGVAQSTTSILAELAQKNEEYYQKFGFIFIVFATGKTALEMLALLQTRLPNSREVELKNAADEQRKITDLRLKKLFTEK